MEMSFLRKKEIECFEQGIKMGREYAEQKKRIKLILPVVYEELGKNPSFDSAAFLNGFCEGYQIIS